VRDLTDSGGTDNVRSIMKNSIALAFLGGLLGLAVPVAAGVPAVSDAAPALASTVVETRVVKLTQTVTLTDIPEGARQLRMWVPVPSDGSWQRVLDSRVVSAPGEWKLLNQSEGRGKFVYVEVQNPAPGSATVVFEATVERKGVHFPLDGVTAASALQPGLFTEHLDPSAPLMEVTPQIRKLADQACGDERDVVRQAVKLLRHVAATADHYSKDPSKPHCGPGAADDCLTNGGGCCTDLHSLFIALARARGIPARIQFGYRLLDSRAGTTFDPSYRCYVEFFAPGLGWVPNDIVASDGVKASSRYDWGSLSATRIWLWSGRNFELNPPAAAGRINSMFCGWAEIDGKPVDVLPDADDTPSRLGRTLNFQILHSERNDGGTRLPE